jgi:putative ATPase
MRGSDPDAAVYYLARMLYAGEDPKFIARRMVICASEDVGNADPHALMLAVAAMQAVEFIGLPECKINMSQAAAYIACAPKSNASVNAIMSAWDDVADIQIKTIPPHLRDANFTHDSLTGGVVSQFDRGAEYKYAHAFPGHFVRQQYLPDEVADKVYYKPSENGVEKKIKESLEKLRPKRYIG